MSQWLLLELTLVGLGLLVCLQERPTYPWVAKRVGGAGLGQIWCGKVPQVSSNAKEVFGMTGKRVGIKGVWEKQGVLV